MPTQETLYNVANRVATITLNRPDKLNAWTALMESEVRSHMENAEQDDEVRVIVLTGAGRGFCAGADMSLLSAVAERGLDYGGNSLTAIQLPARARVLVFVFPQSVSERPTFSKLKRCIFCWGHWGLGKRPWCFSTCRRDCAGANWPG